MSCSPFLLCFILFHCVSSPKWYTGPRVCRIAQNLVHSFFLLCELVVAGTHLRFVDRISRSGLPLARKSIMNHFVTVFRKFVSLKVSVALFTLGILGIASGSQFFLSSPSAFAATNCQYYTVKSGDTLSGIGATYHTSYQAIAQVNNISNANLIFPGQRFCIPANGSTYTPVQGTQQAPASTTPAPVTHAVTTPAPAPVAPSSSVTGMIEQIFGDDAPEALNIARCESGLNPNAYNPTSIGGSHAAGVFQILYPSTWAGTPEAGASPYNAWANIEAAHAIFVRDGYSWREWTC